MAKLSFCTHVLRLTFWICKRESSECGSNTQAFRPLHCEWPRPLSNIIVKVSQNEIPWPSHMKLHILV